MFPWQPERDPWAEIKAVAHVPEKRPTRPQRRPRPRLERLAVRVTGVGVVIMLGMLVVVAILLVVVLAGKL